MKKCAEKVSQVIVTSPIGDIVVGFCPYGLHSVNQAPDIDDSNFKPVPGQGVAILENSLENKHVQDCVNWLDTYFHKPNSTLKAKVPQFCIIEKTTDAPFYDKVYVALLKVPFGETVSYKELAALAGSPSINYWPYKLSFFVKRNYNNADATRATGSAMANNPFQIVVPCHRVLPSPSSSGKQSIGNYSRGKKVSVKEWLLNYEGHEIKNGNLI